MGASHGVVVCFVSFATAFGYFSLATQLLLFRKNHARFACSVVNALPTARCRYQLLRIYGGSKPPPYRYDNAQPVGTGLAPVLICYISHCEHPQGLSLQYNIISIRLLRSFLCGTPSILQAQAPSDEGAVIFLLKNG